jgi:hypothetical protein
MMPTRWRTQRISDGISPAVSGLSGGRKKTILDSGPTSAAGRLKQEREYKADFQERRFRVTRPAALPERGTRRRSRALLDGQAQGLTEKAVEMAMAAPPTSMIWPPTEIINAVLDAGRPRSRTTPLNLPTVKQPNVRAATIGVDELDDPHSEVLLDARPEGSLVHSAERQVVGSLARETKRCGTDAGSVLNHPAHRVIAGPGALRLQSAASPHG